MIYFTCLRHIFISRYFYNYIFKDFYLKDTLFSDTPSEIAARSLILVAKCLQNLANLVEFGGKVITFFKF